MFGRATIRLGIGPHSSLQMIFNRFLTFFGCDLLVTASRDGDKSKKILHLMTRLLLTVVW